MNLITGRAGAAHITPRQDAMWHQGLIEMESCIFDAYENFAAEIITNNEVRIRSGVGMLQGRFFCIEPNTYDSAEIANGNQGEKRIDLIVARIAVDATANTQSASIEVIQGTPSAENPTAPEAVTGDLDAGDLIADYPLVEVHINGINITSVENAFNAGWLSLPQTRQKINFIGTNPIASVAEDTTANWAALGTGVAYISGDNKVSNQPYTHGFIENYVYNSVVRQIWYSQSAGGNMWIRAGISSGWYTPWIKVLNENNGIQIEKVWENASPSSDFAAQTITLDDDSSEYDLFIMEFRTLKGYYYETSAIARKGINQSINDVLNIAVNGATPIFAMRRVIVASGSATFTDCNIKTASATALSVNNGYIIPTAIYGIKGVQ